MKTEIRELFVDDPELVEGFEGFLPDRNLEQGVDKGVEGDTVL
jgi:histone deacetylase complex regulatory component SIN3